MRYHVTHIRVNYMCHMFHIWVKFQNMCHMFHIWNSKICVICITFLCQIPKTMFRIWVKFQKTMFRIWVKFQTTMFLIWVKFQQTPGLCSKKSHTKAGLVYKKSPMGWLRLVGSLNLQVSFAEYRLFYRSLLQKRPSISRSILVAATP